MNKKDLVKVFAQHLEEELVALRSAAQATYDAATNEESRPENEYDTRALEASYLAGAQAKRVSEVTEVLSLLKTLDFRNFAKDESVQSTALVDVSLDGRKTRLLVMPKGGGEQLNLPEAPVQIVTPSSALGESILGLHVGDVAEFEVGPKTRECEILAIQ